MCSSPITGTLGPHAPSLPGALPRPSARLFLKLLGAFLASLALWLLVRRPYNRLIVYAGAQVLAPFASRGVEEMIVERGSEIYLASGLVSRDGTQVHFRLEVNPVSWNSIFFATLLVMTPLELLRSRRAYLAIAVLLLAASHVGFFSFATFTMLATAYDKYGVGFIEPWLLRSLGMATQLYANMFSIALPFLLYAPVVLWRRRPAARRAQPGPAPLRNAPCPCGSGLKFKRCCGR